MKRIYKVALYFIIVAMLCFAPIAGRSVSQDGPGPDDRPISYIG